MNILFETNLINSFENFQHFPLKNFRKDIAILMTKDTITNNTLFINIAVIRGLKIIEIQNEYNLKKLYKNQGKLKLNLIVKALENSTLDNDSNNNEFNHIPTIYYPIDSNNSNLFEYKLTFLCKNCSDPCERMINVTKSMKPPVFCSNKCIMENSTKEEDDFMIKPVKSIDIDIERKESIGEKSDKNTYLYVNVSSEPGKVEKFQDSMRREAIRLVHAERREKYKKHMRQISTRKSNPIINTKSLKSVRTLSSTKSIKTCKANTQKKSKGNPIRCTNKATKNSEYCGIPSHKKLSKEKTEEKIMKINEKTELVL